MRSSFIKISSLILICLLCLSVRAQVNFNKQRDSAYALERSHTRPDTNRVNALLAVLTWGVNAGGIDSVKHFLPEAKQLSRQLNFDKGISHCYSFLGFSYRKRKLYDSAAIFFDSALQVLVNSKQYHVRDLMQRTAINKGYCYFLQENYMPALQAYQEALSFDSSRQSNYTSSAYSMISSIYLQTNNFSKAAEYARYNLNATLKQGNKKSINNAYLDLLQPLIRLQNFTEARACINNIDTEKMSTAFSYINYRYQLMSGIVCRHEGKYDESFTHLEKAYYAAEKVHYGVDLGEILNELLITCLDSDRLAEAKKYLVIYEQLATENGFKKDLRDMCRRYADYYALIGDHRKAFGFSRRSVIYGDSLINEENIKQVNLLEANFESERKKSEILRLQKEEALKEVSLQRQSLLNKIFIAAIALLLVIALLGYRAFISKQRLAKQQQELQEQKIRELEKDKQLMAVDAMLRGQEEERGRLAKDLHDGLGGLLSGVKLSLVNMKENMIMTADNISVFERALNLLDASIREMRQVAHNLMPEALVKLGLDEALRDFCTSIDDAGSTKIVYQSYGSKEKLPSSTETMIYRIVQELLNNAVKYASAKNILVQLSRNNNKIDITVEDDGIGFDTAILNNNKGAGWSNIRSRIDYLKGELDLRSAPEKGTSVNIQLSV